MSIFSFPLNDLMIDTSDDLENRNHLINDQDRNSPKSSELDYYSTDVISNGNFSLGYDSWFNETGGDDSDINSSINGGHANYEIMGESHIKKIDDPIDDAHEDNWVAFNKTEPAINPDNFDINNSGFVVNHEWEDATSDQVASIYWRYNVSMDGIDMSKYNITSAKINATMFAHVDWNIDTQYDTSSGPEGDINQRGIFDHAFFYVEISDLNLNTYYRICYNQTSDLGRDDTSFYTINEKTIESQGTEKDLVYYLTQLFAKDPEHNNFSIIVGIEINCEDNINSRDYDHWDDLWITSLNLTFTYDKLINDFSSESWSQVGSKIEGENRAIVNATLNFEYKINQTWWDTTHSQNSEFRIFINEFKLLQTIKLNDTITEWQLLGANGVDVTPFVYVNEFINLSIQVFIADEFSLNQRINISIDNVTLVVWYSIETPPIDTEYDLFLNSVNKTLAREIEVGIGEMVNITFFYTNTSGDFIPDATITLQGAGIDTTLEPHTDFNQYNRTIDTGPLGFGDKYLTINAYKRYYQEIEFTIRIRITNRYAYIDKKFLNQTQQTGISLTSGEPLNITVDYIDNSTKTFIDGATVRLDKGTQFLGYLDNTTSFKHYNITIDTSILDEGVSYLTVLAEKENYTIASQTFTVYISAKTTNYKVYLNNTQDNYISGSTGNLIEVNFTYYEEISKLNILGARVTINGSSFSGIMKSYGNENYSIRINTTNFGQGIHFLTVYATNNSCEPQSVLLTINLDAKETFLIVYLNMTEDNDLYFASTVNKTLYINITYTLVEGGIISGARVTLNGSDISEVLHDYGSGNYSLALNTSKLNQGVNFFNIYAVNDTCLPQSILITIEIVQTQTNILLYINGTNQNLTPNQVIVDVESFTPGDNYNITLSYIDVDQDPSIRIPDATINITGAGFSDNLLPNSLNNYSIIIEADELNWGVNYLSILAQNANYEPQTITLKFEVIAKVSTLDLFLNGKNMTGEEDVSITLEWNNNINVTAYYRDNNKNYIDQAKLNISGEDYFKQLVPYANTRYNSTVNSTSLGVGVFYLTLTAIKTNYESHTVIFRVEIIDRVTIVNFFLNDDNLTSLSVKSITLEWDNALNITIMYKDNSTQLPINLAKVSLNGTGVSEQISDVGNQYEILINTKTLGIGVHYLTVNIFKDNYTSKTIPFTVEVIYRETSLKLSLNGEIKTSKPSIDIAYGKRLTIEIEYIDVSSDSFISNAQVNITGEDVDDLLDEDQESEVYSIGIKSETLDIGTRFLSILTTKGGYESQTIRITVNVKRIRTEIATIDKNTTIIVAPGDSVNISIELKDLNFGGRIKGATVNYTWERGQGTLEDPDGDGIYTAILTQTNIPDGVYTITITVYAADEYDFERFLITLNIESPEESVLLFQISLGLAIGGVVALSSYLVAYQKVLKYPKPIRKLRKFRKTLKKKSIPDVQIKSRDTSLRKEYESQLGPLNKALKVKSKITKEKTDEKGEIRFEESIKKSDSSETDVFLDDSKDSDTSNVD